MAATSVKDKIIRAVEEMPADITYEDVMERIYILQKVETGRQQIEAGEGIPHDEAKCRLQKWHA